MYLTHIIKYVKISLHLTLNLSRLILTRNKILVTEMVPLQGGGGGGRCLHGNLWYSPPASITSRLASVTFEMASKVFIEETDKNFDSITEILFRFLGFGDFKALLT